MIICVVCLSIESNNKKNDEYIITEGIEGTEGDEEVLDGN